MRLFYILNTSAFIILASTIFYSSGFAQHINQNWKSDLTDMMTQFKQCESTSTTQNSCHEYMGKSVKAVYMINDFYSKDKKRYMAVSEMQEFLDNTKSWTKLGFAYDQEVLNKAQDIANRNKACIAIYLNDTEIGHMVTILPGELQPSGSWGVKVPNSASFFSPTPEQSYINKGLSYAFTKRHLKDVVIYAKNY